mmetsp:Transcript_49307/g.96719  ORF Transcript_49307/g.96719 Transcript_49307/m.96719 type:complete len:393 (-) Transcript_49307:41-1219(-)
MVALAVRTAWRALWNAGTMEKCLPRSFMDCFRQSGSTQDSQGLHCSLVKCFSESKEKNLFGSRRSFFEKVTEFGSCSHVVLGKHVHHFQSFDRGTTHVGFLVPNKTSVDQVLLHVSAPRRLVEITDVAGHLNVQGVENIGQIDLWHVVRNKVLKFGSDAGFGSFFGTLFSVVGTSTRASSFDLRHNVRDAAVDDAVTSICGQLRNIDSSTVLKSEHQNKGGAKGNNIADPEQTSTEAVVFPLVDSVHPENQRHEERKRVNGIRYRANQDLNSKNLAVEVVATVVMVLHGNFLDRVDDIVAHRVHQEHHSHHHDGSTPGKVANSEASVLVRLQGGYLTFHGFLGVDLGVECTLDSLKGTTANTRADNFERVWVALLVESILLGSSQPVFVFGR